MNTVLVVEDTPSERELLSHYLQQSGYTVIDASSGKEALDKAITQKPDVIVTDIVMPGMSGFELCRNLKRHPETEKVPIVVCSSKDQYIDRLWGLKQGATLYITKPFTREQLIHAVESVVH
ncbi:MAG: response regulator [Elainella sp. Prado103]|jgi:twitching motility two-component system response regulator PilH|nr:response regulator [Elainella sp. Prado103]